MFVRLFVEFLMNKKKECSITRKRDIISDKAKIILFNRLAKVRYKEVTGPLVKFL
jgi:hypothetical protein